MLTSAKTAAVTFSRSSTTNPMTQRIAIRTQADRTVVRPLACELGSARRLTAKNAGFRRQVAATELVPWRGGVVRGVVHDENAWAYAGEGAAGHAGLFGTVRGVLRLGTAIVDAIHESVGNAAVKFFDAGLNVRRAK